MRPVSLVSPEKASLEKIASTSSISSKGREKPTQEKKSLLTKIIKPPVAPFSSKGELETFKNFVKNY